MPIKLNCRKEVLTITILLLACAILASCGKTVVVNNCPPWVEVGTASIDDTEETLRWMYRYETNRQRECR